MDGFKIAGKAFAVFENLRQIAEKNKGMTVEQFLRLCTLEKAVAAQFGMTVEEYRATLKK